MTTREPRLRAVRSRPGRLPQLGDLKTLLVAWIIVGHALLGYVAYGGWEYAEVREVTYGPTLELVLSAVFAPSALVVIGTLFLVAGLFLPGSLAERTAALGGTIAVEHGADGVTAVSIAIPV